MDGIVMRLLHEWILDRSGKGVIFVALTTLERTITKLDTDRR